MRNQSTETVRSADEQIEEAEQEIRDSFFDMAVLTICRYLPSQMVPTDWEHVPVTELYRLFAKAKICREMVQGDIQTGVAKAFSEE